jgi:Cys-rich protein (TIGR01571 family)
LYLAVGIAIQDPKRLFKSRYTKIIMDKPAGAPTQTASGSGWLNDLFDCFSPQETCLFACLIPCVVFGKTAAREEDPTLKDYNAINGKCVGFSCCPHMFLRRERSKLREKYGIEGSWFEDCLTTCFCGVCSIVQLEKESKQRAEAAGYQAPQPMQYP